MKLTLNGYRCVLVSDKQMNLRLATSVETKIKTMISINSILYMKEQQHSPAEFLSPNTEN